MAGTAWVVPAIFSSTRRMRPTLRRRAEADARSKLSDLGDNHPDLCDANPHAGVIANHARLALSYPVG
jgi:hypothetical protein